MIDGYGDIDSHNWQGYDIIFLNFSYFDKEPAAEKDLETIIEAGRHAFYLSAFVCGQTEEKKKDRTEQDMMQVTWL